MVPFKSVLRGSLAVFVGLILCGLSAHAQAGFSFGQTQRGLGSASVLGYAMWTAPLGEVVLNGHRIPLRLDFTTDPRPPPSASPLGRGWSIPFFSSALIDESQTTMRWHRPDGKVYYFARERGNQTGRPTRPTDPVEFVSTEASWRAVKDPRKRFVVISHVSNGSELFYEDGRLVRFSFAKSSEKGDVYLISYNRLGRPQRLSLQGSSNALVEFSYDTAYRAKSLTIGDKTIALKFADAALNQFPEGPYLCEVGAGSLLPLAITYQAEGGDVNRARFERLIDGGGNTGLAWQARSGFIIEDDGATYKIENPSLVNGGRAPIDPKQPAAQTGGLVSSNWRPEEAKVTRVDREGKSEYRYVDRTRGISTTRGKDGVTKMVYFMRAQGPLMNKIRKIEEIRDGKTTIVERNAYDERGRILRRIDGEGNLDVWEYLGGGEMVRKIQNGVVKSEHAYADGKLIGVKFYSDKGIRTFFPRKDSLTESSIKEIESIFDKY